MIKKSPCIILSHDTCNYEYPIQRLEIQNNKCKLHVLVDKFMIIYLLQLIYWNTNYRGKNTLNNRCS